MAFGTTGWAEHAWLRGWPPAFHSFYLPLLTSLSHAQCRCLGILGTLD